MYTCNLNTHYHIRLFVKLFIIVGFVEARFCAGGCAWMVHGIYRHQLYTCNGCNTGTLCFA